MTKAHGARILLRGLVALALVAGLAVALLWPPPAWGALPDGPGAGPPGHQAVVPMPTVTGGEGPSLLTRPEVSRGEEAPGGPAAMEPGASGRRRDGGGMPARDGADGAWLFENHCAGCHVNGGNIIRRGKTLKLKALERNGIDGPDAIAAIAADGIGRMGGYGAVLGEGGPEVVAGWVWEQAQAGWPRG